MPSLGSLRAKLGRSSRPARTAVRSYIASHFMTSLAREELIRRTRNFNTVSWMGQPIWQNPLDIWSVQEAIVDRQVDLVIECGTNRGGSALFIGHLFDLMGRGHVITIDVEDLVQQRHPRVEYLVGSSTDETVVATVHRRATELGAKEILVFLNSDHRAPHVLAEMRAYADLINAGGYFFVQDGVIDELRIMKDARPGPLVAIRQFIAEDRRFEVDEERSERYVVVHSPSGWVRRRS